FVLWSRLIAMYSSVMACCSASLSCSQRPSSPYIKSAYCMSSPFCRCRDYDERATAISTSRTEYADLFGGQPLVARRAVWTACYTFAAHGHLTKTGVGHRFYAAERQGLAGRPHPLEQGQ